jgi:small subunit ribosomal protein S6
MKIYELTYLMPIDISEDAAKSLQEKISSCIADAQGTLNKIEDTTKRRLGEPIKKQKEAQMATIDFYMNPEKLGDFEKKIKAEARIIKHIILNKKTRKVESARKIRHLAPVVAEENANTTEKTSLPGSKPKKVEIKEIEKKLEEILGE